MMVIAVVKEHLHFEVQIIAPLWLEELGKFLHNLGKSYSCILSFCLDSFKSCKIFENKKWNQFLSVPAENSSVGKHPYLGWNEMIPTFFKFHKNLTECSKNFHENQRILLISRKFRLDPVFWKSGKCRLLGFTKMAAKRKDGIYDLVRIWKVEKSGFFVPQRKYHLISILCF